MPGRSAFTRTSTPAPGQQRAGSWARASARWKTQLLDAHAKRLGVPCYEVLGGKVRDALRVYWSHCPAWRINHPQHYGPAITDLAGVETAAAGARARLLCIENEPVHPRRRPVLRLAARFSSPFSPELNVDGRVIRNLRATLEALRRGAGDDIDILVDLNFHAKTEGYLKILRAIQDFDLFWVELDSYSPDALAFIRGQSRFPISSCETLFGGRELLPFLRRQAVDVAIIDTVWNGAWQAMKMADLCDIHEVNVAPFYGHLCTLMNAHFAAAVPNFRIMETDIDRLAWDDALFTHAPQYRDGHLIVPDRPGWGTEPDEAALRAHPPKPHGLIYARKH